MAEVEWSRSESARAPSARVAATPSSSSRSGRPNSMARTCRRRSIACWSARVARRAATRAYDTVPTLITPTIWSGLAEHHMSLGATLSVDFPTFFALVRGICRSLVRHGFRNVLLLNGHGGNIAALTVAVNELAVELDAPIATTTYFCWRSRRSRKILEQQTDGSPRLRGGNLDGAGARSPSSWTCRSRRAPSDRRSARCRKSPEPRRRIAGDRSNRGPRTGRSEIRGPQVRKRRATARAPPRTRSYAS